MNPPRRGNLVRGMGLLVIRFLVAYGLLSCPPRCTDPAGANEVLADAGGPARAREYVFMTREIRGSGAMKLMPAADMKSYWTCSWDVADIGTAQATYYEVEFNAIANAPYKFWVYAGACCEETFTVYMQGTDMSGPNPLDRSQTIPYWAGGVLALPVVHKMEGLKKKHVEHGGDKGPARWDWVSIPLPEYSGAGPKKVRLLVDQKGYSVGMVVVSTTRQKPPTPEETRRLFNNPR